MQLTTQIFNLEIVDNLAEVWYEKGRVAFLECCSGASTKVLSCESVEIVDLLKCDVQPKMHMSYLDICIK